MQNMSSPRSSDLDPQTTFPPIPSHPLPTPHPTSARFRLLFYRKSQGHHDKLLVRPHHNLSPQIRRLLAHACPQDLRPKNRKIYQAELILDPNAWGWIFHKQEKPACVISLLPDGEGAGADPGSLDHGGRSKENRLDDNVAVGAEWRNPSGMVGQTLWHVC